MRIHVAQYRMSCAQADTLLYFLQNDIQVSSAKVYERTGDAVICYDGSRAELIDKLRHFHYEDVESNVCFMSCWCSLPALREVIRVRLECSVMAMLGTTRNIGISVSDKCAR